MKPLDQFKRTPPRRYDKAPPPPPGDKRTFEPAIRKRYFDMPTFDHRHIDRWLGGAVCAVLLLTLCNASAPMGDVPSVQERFSQWAVIQNEKTVQQLPGATPEPDSALAAAASFNPDQEKQEVKQEAKQETILAQEETRQETAQTQTTADTSTGFKHYEPGQLHYESDGITVSIEQKTKDGMTYFVCDIQLERVEQFRTAFAGDDFKSGIYEAVSDIAGRYNPVLAINADFCRYHRDGVIIRNGEVLRRQNIKKHHLLVVDQNGDLSAQTDRSGKQGLVANKLEQAKTELERMLEQIPESGCYAQQRLRNDTLTAYAVTLAALERKTSTGCHVRTDSAGEPEKYRVNIRCENGRAVPRRTEI